LALDSLETERRPLVEALGELRLPSSSRRCALPACAWSGRWADAASEAELPASETLHVLRIVREALTNVIKHARASVAWLRLEARAGRRAGAGGGRQRPAAARERGAVALAAVRAEDRGARRPRSGQHGAAREIARRHAGERAASGGLGR
jgi:two-component sensor histidine kinase